MLLGVPVEACLLMNQMSRGRPEREHDRTSNGRRYHRILFERLCTARKCVAAKCAAAAANSGRAARSEGVSGAVTPELSVSGYCSA